MSVIEKNIQTASISAVTATGNIVSAVAGQRIYVVAYILSQSGTTPTTQWTDAATPLEGVWPSGGAAGTRTEVCPSNAACLFKTSAGNALGLAITGTSPVVNGRVSYYVAP